MHECQNIKRLLIVGGAGSLLNDKNEVLVETSAFPEAWKAHAREQGQALTTYRNSDINWTYFSPSLYYDPELPTVGKFKIDNNHLIINRQGKSEISYGDAALLSLMRLKIKSLLKNVLLQAIANVLKGKIKNGKTDEGGNLTKNNNFK